MSIDPLRWAVLLRPAKVGLAAALALLAVVPMGGTAEQYPYYAPLGAVVAVSSTVAGSLREALEGVSAIILGAALALAITPFTDFQVLAVAIVVAVGSWLGGWHWFGDMGEWVPLGAMFVLIIGQGDPARFAVAYLGLTSLGAAIGVLVNLAFPPLPLTESSRTQRRVRSALVDQLSNLAAALRYDEPPTAEQWREQQSDTAPMVEQMRRALSRAAQARRGNWRAPRWRASVEQQYGLAFALDRLAALVEDIVVLLSEHEQAGREWVALGPRLRPSAADVLDAMGRALDSVDGRTADPDRLREVDEALHVLVGAIRETRTHSHDDLFIAGTVVVYVRSAIASLVPEELAEELPS